MKRIFLFVLLMTLTGALPALAGEKVTVNGMKVSPEFAKMAREQKSRHQLFHYKHPGRDPYRGTLQQALVLLDYPPDVAKILLQKVECQCNNFDLFVIEHGDVFVMTFAKNSVRKSVADFGMGYDLDAKLYTAEVDGIIYRLVVPKICGNWSRYPEKRVPVKPCPPPKVIEPVPPVEPAPPVIEIPPAPPEIVPPPEVEAPPEPPTENEKCTFWDGIRAELYVGAGKGFNSGARNGWFYADLTVYPFSLITEHGRQYFGIGDAYTAFKSRDRVFEGHGYRNLVKPLVAKDFNYDNHSDISLAPIFGWQEFKGNTRDGRYQLSKYAKLAGGGLQYNNYARESEGERWFAETQAWLTVLVATDNDINATFDGHSADGGHKTTFVLDAGARQFIYNAKYIRTYAQFEYLGELPDFNVINLELGVSDKWKIFFAGAGVQFNLNRGGIPSRIFDVGMDVGEAGRLGIRKYRESKVRSKVESTYGKFTQDEETGAVLLQNR